jgi:membrane protease YdiL (CAAX protease family)
MRSGGRSVPDAIFPQEATTQHPPEAVPLAVKAEAVPLPAMAAPRFCTACGSQWQQGWINCRVCECHQQERIAAAIREPLERSRITPALWLYFALLAASAAGLLTGLGHVDRASLLIWLTGAHSAIIFLWSVWAWRDVVPALGKPVSPRWFLIAIAAACGTFLLASIIIGGLHHLLGLQRIDLDDALLARGGWPLVVGLVCIQPAVFEEIGFRGVILPALQPALAPSEAVIVSALLFMTLHLTIGSFPHLFVMGLVLGYLRVKTGSLLPGMLMHFAHNLLCVLPAAQWT